jgi:RNA polymerase sigma-70 factor (ECF subfamily)
MAADASPANPDGAAVVAQMRPALLRYFLRRADSIAEAEDLTQDVLIRSLTHLHWHSLEEAKGYIFRTAINRWHDRYREVQTRTKTAEGHRAAQVALGTESPPEAVLIAREELAQIFEALEGMNARTRTVLVLVKVEQMKATVVAERLGISVRAVNKHLSKAIAALIRVRKRQEWLR